MVSVDGLVKEMVFWGGSRGRFTAIRTLNTELSSTTTRTYPGTVGSPTRPVDGTQSARAFHIAAHMALLLAIYIFHLLPMTVGLLV